ELAVDDAVREGAAGYQDAATPVDQDGVGVARASAQVDQDLAAGEGGVEIAAAVIPCHRRGEGSAGVVIGKTGDHNAAAAIDGHGGSAVGGEAEVSGNQAARAERGVERAGVGIPCQRGIANTAPEDSAD